MKERIAWIDNLKFFCIFAVMAEHALVMTGYTDAINSPFYINGFFFVSGYLYKQKYSFKEFFITRVRQLFIPWFVFSLFIILSTQVLTYDHNRDIAQALVNNFKQIRGSGDEMWFVAALFVASFPFYFLVGCVGVSKKKIYASLIELLFLSICGTLFMNGELSNTVCHLPWHIEFIPKALLLMLSGYAFRMFFESKFDKANTRANRFALGVVYFSLVLIPQFAHIPIVGAWYIIYLYFAAIIGISFFTSISKAVGNKRCLSFVGRNTMGYYGLHGKIESVIHMTLAHFFGAPYYDMCWNNLTEFVPLCKATALSYLIAAIASVLLFVPVFLLEKWIPFVLGKKTAK